MDWSSMSPDLNPNEHLWGIKHNVEERKVSNIHQLRDVVMMLSTSRVHRVFEKNIYVIMIFAPI